MIQCAFERAIDQQRFRRRASRVPQHQFDRRLCFSSCRAGPHRQQTPSSSGSQRPDASALTARRARAARFDGAGPHRRASKRTPRTKKIEEGKLGVILLTVMECWVTSWRSGMDQSSASVSDLLSNDIYQPPAFASPFLQRSRQRLAISSAFRKPAPEDRAFTQGSWLSMIW